MPIVLTNEEKLEVIKRRVINLRQMYAEHSLTIELLKNNNDEPSEEIEANQNLLDQIEANLQYLAIQQEALEESRLDEALDVSMNGKKTKAK